MMYHIIHTADLHLDAPFSGLADGKKATMRQEELRTSFARIVFCAKNADALVISGDLFEGAQVSRTTLEFLKKQFAEIPDKKVFICAGNHDPLTEKSAYRTFDFGENVHIFGTEPECVETDDVDFYGVSFQTGNDDRVLLPEFSVKHPEKINILVMHGNLAGEGYNPIKPSDIAESGMDYIALGHIHKGSGLLKSGMTHYAYPGCHEGRGFDETGEKGVLSVEIGKGIVSASFVPMQERMYIEEYIDISGAESYDDIMEKIRPFYLGNQHVYRLILSGEASFPVATEIVAEKVEAFSVEVRDETKPAADLEQLKQEFSLKGLFVKYALEEKETVSPELFDAAIKAGLSFIEKEERNENR
ncbi:MAG: DNA repair exonuclease [Clostridia bacterium]|nr:DNA repair exonuclease [Clostridia bacterium]